MIIYLVRHTPADAPTGVIYGRTDVPVNSAYNTLLPLIRHKLPSHSITLCYSSPLRRCLELAQDLCPMLQVQVEPRLQELDFGDWEMKTWDTIDQQQAKYWGDHFVDTPCPNGESFKQLHSRVMDFWQELHTLPEDAVVLVVTHAGVIRSILSDVTCRPLSDMFNIQVGTGSITKLVSTNGTDQLAFTNQ
jgi:alpha-ribazole phosphatase